MQAINPQALKEILEKQKEAVEHLGNLWASLVETLSQSGVLSLTLLQKEMKQRYPEPRPGSVFELAYQDVAKMVRRNQLDDQD